MHRCKRNNMPHLFVRLLGGLQVLVDGIPVTTFESDKVRALLAYLTVETRPHPRLALADLLWPEMPEGSARHNLSQVLFNLRQVIGDRRADPPFLLISREQIGFNLASDQRVDLLHCKTLLDACDSHPHPHRDRCADCAARWQQAVTLYEGDFLHHFFLNDSAPFEEWILLQREQLRRRILTALTHLTTYHEASGDYGRALQSCERLLALDAWHEEAHGQMMRLLAQSGQRSAALAHFDTCRRILADELGVEPAAETKALYTRIRNGEFDPVTKGLGGNVNDSTPPRTGASAHSHSPTPLYNLPTQLTPFVGREHELAAIKQLLADPDCRLLTLVGAGGMGKTRLALAAAAQQQGQFRNGIAFVPLTAVTSAPLIAPAIADAIGFAFFGATDLQQQLLNHLRDQELLLVLDNLEHLLTDDQGSLTVLALLQGAPRIKLLVTSREPLQIQSEWLFAVEGMGQAATALFLQSVRRTRAGLVLDAADQPLIEQICHLVGEMPLGIELAAAWARTLSYAEIAQEIERNFDFLTGTGRDLPTRHRSLRVVFDQSWALLSPAEQQGLQRAAVFRGGFRREAAAQVAELSLTRLAALVHKFLLRQSTEGRYDLHEVIRQYAVLRLQEDAEEERRTRTRHALYYLEQVQSFDDALHSNRQKEALAALTADLGNIRTALAWAITNQAVEQLCRVAGALQHYYDVRNTFREGETTFRQAVEMVQQLLDHGAIARDMGEVVLGQLQAYWAWFIGRLGMPPPERRLALLHQSITLLRRHAAHAPLADALWIAGVCCWHVGRFDEADQHLRESLALNQTLQRAWSSAAVRADLGWVTYHRGHATEAEAILRETLGQGRLLGDPRLVALTIGYLSHTLHGLGRLLEMHDLLHESLTLSQETGDRVGRLYALEHLAYEAQLLGNHSEAQATFAAFFALSKEIGNVQGQTRVQNALGRQAVHTGDWAQAQRYFMAALQAADATHLTTNLLDALVGIALLRVQAGDAVTALTLTFYVLHHPTCTQVVKNRAEQVYTDLKPQVTAGQIAAAETLAQTKPLQVLIHELLTDSLTSHWVG